MERENSGCARFPIEDVCVILEHGRFRFGITTTSRTARFIESVENAKFAGAPNAAARVPA